MKHMKLDDRNRLEFLAACGRSANQIAEDRGSMRGEREILCSPILEALLWVQRDFYATPMR